MRGWTSTRPCTSGTILVRCSRSGCSRRAATRSARRRRTSSDRKSTRLNSSHGYISYAVFCLKKKKNVEPIDGRHTMRRVHLQEEDMQLTVNAQVLVYSDV